MPTSQENKTKQDIIDFLQGLALPGLMESETVGLSGEPEEAAIEDPGSQEFVKHKSSLPGAFAAGAGILTFKGKIPANQDEAARAFRNKFYTEFQKDYDKLKLSLGKKNQHLLDQAVPEINKKVDDIFTMIQSAPTPERANKMANEYINKALKDLRKNVGLEDVFAMTPSDAPFEAVKKAAQGAEDVADEGSKALTKTASEGGDIVKDTTGRAVKKKVFEPSSIEDLRRMASEAASEKPDISAEAIKDTTNAIVPAEKAAAKTVLEEAAKKEGGSIFKNIAKYGKKAGKVAVGVGALAAIANLLTRGNSGGEAAKPEDSTNFRTRDDIEAEELAKDEDFRDRLRAIEDEYQVNTDEIIKKLNDGKTPKGSRLRKERALKRLEKSRENIKRNLEILER